MSDCKGRKDGDEEKRSNKASVGHKYGAQRYKKEIYGGGEGSTPAIPQSVL